MKNTYCLTAAEVSGTYYLTTDEGFEEVVCNSVNYKGFRIVKSTIDNVYPWIVPWFLAIFFFEDEKPCRFKTLAAAKAAITRYIQKRGEPCR